jgi:DNA helicase II / ATP-dependent DNA helicase PcrA
MFQPRPKQQEVLTYTAGRMGVSAVPGSGKTQVLSCLAAQLAAGRAAGPGHRLDDDQEVLVVTLVNSAVDNFAARVAGFMGERGLLPHVGYRVRTLHALAHDIVRERPALVGLADDFQIVDEREAQAILRQAAAAWEAGHSDALYDFAAPDLSERQIERLRHDPQSWPAVVSDVALSVIKQAKDRGLSPAELRDSLDKHADLDLLEMSFAIYADYQRSLAYRGAVDFDDLVRLALRALEGDGEYLQRLRRRWPYILEDEAQDSSASQERLLRLLCGPTGNWVRVGDPNQAIYETFTTANPRYLRGFLAEPGVVACNLPNSGRATLSLIGLANYLVDWTQAQHPVAALRNALVLPHIEPTPGGDPQANPDDDPAGILFLNGGRRLSPVDELNALARSLAAWLPEHPDSTVAVLAPRNQRGAEVVKVLKERGIEVVELLRSSDATRRAAGALTYVLQYLSEPTSAARLASVLRVWRRHDRGQDAARRRVDRLVQTLEGCSQVEDFLWPRAGRDWLAGLQAEGEQTVVEPLLAFRDLVRRWLGSADLPIDQLILTLAQDLFTQPAELAIAHKLATVLRAASRSHPEWRLPELTQELAAVAKNERKFLGFGEGDTGFDPRQHAGKAVVATIHKAKGLEWDRVYLISVNTYDFPSALPGDAYIGEKRFVRGQLNLVAEALAQLAAVRQEEILAPYEEPGVATRQARLEYAAERLRLLYVGITRARRELIFSWNTGRSAVSQREAAPLIALRTWWEGRRIAAEE